MKIELIEKDGNLYTPRSAIADPALLNFFESDPILVGYDTNGDVETVEWPNPNHESLFRCLYSTRECGVIPGNTQSVFLPDGSEFSISSDV